MIDILAAPAALPFVVALMVMVFIAILEGVSLFFGAAISGFLDGVLPDFDLPDLDGGADGGVDIGGLESVGPLTYLMSWLSFGKAPALVLLIAFLTVFGLAGLTALGVVSSVTGILMPGWLAAIPAVMVALPGTRYLGRAFGAILPKEETEAVSTDRFIGKVAVIIRGECKRGQPAEAKLKDMHGQTHWILVEPDEDDEEFGGADEVIIVSQAGSIYRVIRNTHQVLSRGR